MKAWRTVAGLSILLLFSGCSRDQPPARRSVDEDRILVLEPVLQDGVAQAWQELLRSKWPGAQRAAAGQWEAALHEALESEVLVVIPDSARLPVEAGDWLDAFIGAGGHALFLGAAPFSDPVIRYAAEPMPTSAYMERLMRQAESIDEFSVIQLWSHERTAGAPSSRVRAAHGIPWQGVEVDVSGLLQSDVMALPEPVEALAELDIGAIALFVRGSENTSRLTLRVRQEDGVEWLYPVAVNDQWQPLVISNSDWHRLKGEQGEGSADKVIDFSQIESFSIGLDTEWVPQSIGPHQYGASDIRVIPQSALRPSTPPPDRPIIGAPAARTVATVEEIRGQRASGHWRMRDESAGFVWQNPAIHHPDDSARWISLFEGGNRRDAASASMAGLYLRQGESLEQWGWIGLDLNRRTRRAIRGMLNEVAYFFQRGHFLLAANTNQHWYEPEESFDLTVHVVGLRPDSPLSVRVSAELRDQDGQIIRRVVSSPLDGTESEISMSLGVVPRVETGAENYSVEFVLEEIGGVSRQFDRLRRPVKVQGAQPAIQTEERIRAMAGRLVAGRIPHFIMGTHYNPGLLRTPDPVWLALDHFPAAQIQSDFSDLRAAGINAISIPYTDLEQARQVRYVLDAARSESLWVTLRLPHAWAWSQQPSGIAPYLDALDFKNDRNVFSLDITPASSPIANIDDLNEVWTDWLQNQAGGLRLAQERWGDWLRFSEEQAVFPSADDLERLPDTADLWPFLHRFLTDWWSRELGRIAHQIRAADYAVLLTAHWDGAQANVREIDEGTLPFLAAAGAVHLDYLTVVPGRLLEGDQMLGGEIFKGAYARGSMYGKPIVWGPLNAPVGGRPRSADYRLQEQMISTFYRLAMQTQTSGGWLGHYQPIAHRPWDADEGIVDLLGRQRPATRALRQTVNQLRGYRMPPLQWGGREMPHPTGPTAWATLQENWSPVYNEEAAERRIVEIRPESFLTGSVDALPARLADLSEAPFLYMHAEWGAVEVNGRDWPRRLPTEPVQMEPQEDLRAEWINRGPARWTASRDQQDGTVWVAVEREGHATHYLPVRAVRPGERIWIEWTPVSPGTYTLRGIWWDRGKFGESLTVHVEESIVSQDT